MAFDPTRRFTQVETAFFWRWWNEQNEFMKNLVKDLVAETSRCRRYVFKNYMNIYCTNFIDTFTKHGNEWVFRNNESFDDSNKNTWQQLESKLCGSLFLFWIFHQFPDPSELAKLRYLDLDHYYCWDSILQFSPDRKLRDFQDKDFLLP